MSPLEQVWNVHANAEWVKRNAWALEAYVRHKYVPEGREAKLRELLRGHPVVARTVIENDHMSQGERWETLVDFFEQSEGGMTLVLGYMGRLKTTFAWDLTHELHERGHTIQAIGDPSTMPDFAEPIDDMTDAERGAYVVNDELASTAGARTSNTRDQKNLGGEIALVRQNKNNVIGIVQNMSLADKTFITLGGNYIIKPLGLMQTKTERAGIAGLLDFWTELVPRDPRETLFISADRMPIYLWRERPDWLDSRLNSAFHRIDDKREAIARAVQYRKKDRDWTFIANRMTPLGWKHNSKTWQAWVKEACGGRDPAPSANLAKQNKKGGMGGDASRQTSTTA